MSLATRITALAQAIGADIKSLQAQIAALGGGGGGSPDPLDLSASNPAPPSANTVRVFGRKLAGRMMPAFVGPSGLDSALQPLLARNKIAWVQPNGNGTVVGALGIAITAAGTATAANVATTGLHASMRRIEYLVTTAATTAVASVRSAAAQFWRGNGQNLGGFMMVMRWGPATGVATATMRAWAGMRNSTAAPTDVEPSSQVNAIGMGWDAADANVQIMHNDASGVATKINLGASFPVPTVDRTAVYELALFCPPNASYVEWEVTDLVSGAVASDRITSDMPASTTLLTPAAYVSAGGTSSVVGIALMSLYIETDC